MSFAGRCLVERRLLSREQLPRLSGGVCFGDREGDAPFTHGGVQAAQFYGAEVYGADGRCLGEVMEENRLLTDRNKRSWAKYTFVPLLGGSYVPYVNYVGYAMYAGYEDFPSPPESSSSRCSIVYGMRPAFWV